MAFPILPPKPAAPAPVQPPVAPAIPAGAPMGHPAPIDPLAALLGGGHAGPMGGPPISAPAVNDAKPKAVLSRFGSGKKKKHKKDADGEK